MNLYEIPMKVTVGQESGAPPGIKVAFVVCYVAAVDHEKATRIGIATAKARGLTCDEIVGQIREVPSNCWNEYINITWPEFKENLPSQIDIIDIVKNGGVFFGPFCGYS